MDWDKLRIFHTVANAGSFTSAGEILNLSQSAVSRQISALEESLGQSLFHRHARGLLLTEQGEILQEVANEVAAQLTLIEGKLADTRQLPEGPLVITVSDFLGTTWLAPKLKKFREMYPDIQLTVLFDERVLNIGMREADAAIRLHRPEQPDLICRHLKKIDFHVCASEDYVKEHGAPKHVSELKNHCLISFPSEAKSSLKEPGWILDLAGINRHTSNNLLFMNSLYAIHKAIQSGAGIGILPDYMIHAKKNLKIILPDVKCPPVDMYFLYAEERRNSKRINAFRDFLLKTIDETPF